MCVEATNVIIDQKCNEALKSNTNRKKIKTFECYQNCVARKRPPSIKVGHK